MTSAEARERQLREMELERKRQREEEPRRHEQAWIDALFAEVDDWIRGKQLREYIQAVPTFREDKFGDIEGSELVSKLAWAESAADEVDCPYQKYHPRCVRKDLRRLRF